MELSCAPPIYERRGVGAFTQDYASSCLAIEICIHTNSGGGEDLHFATTAIKNMKSLVNIPKLMYTHTQTAKDIAHTNTIKAYKKRAAVYCSELSALFRD